MVKNHVTLVGSNCSNFVTYAMIQILYCAGWHMHTLVRQYVVGDVSDKKNGIKRMFVIGKML